MDKREKRPSRIGVTHLSLYPLTFKKAVKALIEVKPEKNPKGMEITKPKTS